MTQRLISDISDAVIAGLRPEWLFDDPSRASADAIRDQVEVCWSYDPAERPTALMVFQSLDALVHGMSQETQESSNRIGVSVYKEAEKRARHPLQLPKPESTTTGTGEGRTSEMEIVDQREDIVQISDGIAPYLTSKPIPDGRRLKKVIVTVVSKDQGWSSYEEDHGTYRNSWTWFELSVGPSSDASVEKWRGEVVRNLHAHDEFKEHTVEVMDKTLYEKAESGDALTVWAHADFPGWENTVAKVTIRCVVE